jgi:hypothetical protein
MLVLVATPWMDRRLRQAGRSELVELDSSGVTLVLSLPSSLAVVICVMCGLG